MARVLLPNRGQWHGKSVAPTKPRADLPGPASILMSPQPSGAVSAFDQRHDLAAASDCFLTLKTGQTTGSGAALNDSHDTLDLACGHLLCLGAIVSESSAPAVPYQWSLITPESHVRDAVERPRSRPPLPSWPILTPPITSPRPISMRSKWTTRANLAHRPRAGQTMDKLHHRVDMDNSQDLVATLSVCSCCYVPSVSGPCPTS